MRYKLEDVLAANPFKDIADVWIKEIRIASKDYDPALDGKFDFVLPYDKGAIIGFNKKVKTKNQRIISNLLPEPFAGNIEAPIWVLQINPSYNPIDYYTTISVNEKTKHFLQANDYKIKSQNIDETIAKRKLWQRLDLMAAQLKLEAKEFIYLNECFNLSDQIHKPDNSYAWWHKALLGSGRLFERKEEVDKNVFVLEGFPYHAKQIGDWREIAKQYSKFWRMAIDYAFQEKKLLVCRSANQWDRLICLSDTRNMSDTEKTDVHFFKNPRCGCLSHRNLSQDVAERIKQRLTEK